MKRSLVILSQNCVHYPLTREELGVKKFYMTSGEDKAVHAVIIDQVVVRLIYCQTDVVSTFNVHGCDTVTSGVTFRCRVATKDGIKHVEMTKKEVSMFYGNPTDAAEGNKHKTISFCASREGIERVFDEAFSHSSKGGKITKKGINCGVAFGYYAWDGLKPIFKYIDLEGCPTISLDKNGWRFDIEPNFDEIDWDNAYTTDEACKKANSIEIYDFSV